MQRRAPAQQQQQRYQSALLLLLFLALLSISSSTMAFAFRLTSTSTRSLATKMGRQATAGRPTTATTTTTTTTRLLMSSSNNNDKQNNDKRALARRGAFVRWLGGMGLLGLAALNLQTTLASNAAAVADAQGKEPEAAAAVVSSMGLDLTPMPLNEALKAADKEGVSKFGKRVLFDAATELPGSGVTSNGFKYTTKEDGVWVSAVSGVPLFDASAKYNSGTGWPSFFQPVDPAHIIERVDPKDKDGKPQFLWRVEVLDRKSGTHLGHVFNDGPQPTGKRYCMNANSMKFIPRAQFAKHLASLPKVATTPTKGMGTEL